AKVLALFAWLRAHCCPGLGDANASKTARRWTERRVILFTPGRPWSRRWRPALVCRRPAERYLRSSGTPLPVGGVCTTPLTRRTARRVPTRRRPDAATATSATVQRTACSTRRSPPIGQRSTRRWKRTEDFP